MLALAVKHGFRDTHQYQSIVFLKKSVPKFWYFNCIFC